MKTRISLLFSALIGLTIMSCSQHEDIAEQRKEIPVQKGDPATMTITLATSPEGTGPVLRSTGLVTQAQESRINTFTVYVYDDLTDLLEKSQTFTPAVVADYTQTLTGLTTGAKKVVVIANPPTAYSALNATNYNNLATNMLDLESQTVSTNLAMSGEDVITLTTAANAISIHLHRIVAKVQLGTITIAPEPGHTGTLLLTKVHIMKATDSISMGVPSITTGTHYYGGMLGTVSTSTKTFLTEALTGAINPTTNPIYFYAFPNRNVGAAATLLTLEGTYNGVTTYFPFVINDAFTGDGSYLTRNVHCIINITIKHAGSGSTDPETPVNPATLEVTIIPEDWFLLPPQNVSW